MLAHLPVDTSWTLDPLQVVPPAVLAVVYARRVWTLRARVSSGERPASSGAANMIGVFTVLCGGLRLKFAAFGAHNGRNDVTRGVLM